MKKGLIMEGGAMRGLFTAGVIDVMMENDIEFDGAVGVSAGAAFGCNLKSRQPGRVLRYNKKYCRNWHFCSIRSLILTGAMYGEEFCYNDIPYKLDPFDLETFRSNPLEFYAVCTDVDTGKAFYHKCVNGDGDDMRYFNASASMPVASRPIEVRGRRYLDGGCSDSVPLKFFEHKGYDRNVVILTQPRGYRKKEEPLRPLFRILLARTPAIRKDLQRRPYVYNRQLDYVDSKADSGEIFAIYPDSDLGIGARETHPDNLERVYKLGREKMERLLPELREFLKG
ncbi:MAG: patatin family protein [Lachnospiraceae bacterium]|nr:patatin family protein [Lachnospiraceae bacterium]